MRYELHKVYFTCTSKGDIVLQFLGIILRSVLENFCHWKNRTTISKHRTTI